MNIEVYFFVYELRFFMGSSLCHSLVRSVLSAALLRGGIVDGKPIHKADILIGPAFISAYKLQISSAVIYKEP